MIKLQLKDKSKLPAAMAFLFTNEKPDFVAGGVAKEDIKLVERLKEAKKPVISIYKADKSDFFHFIESKPAAYQNLESARRAGAMLAGEVKSLKIKKITLATDAKSADMLLAFAEGLALGSYQYGWYKKDVPEMYLQNIILDGKLSQGDVDELEAVVNGTFLARDLINTPASHQSAEQLSASIKETGDGCGFKVEILNKNKIEALKMGGLLSVAAGSLDPPTFNIMEWKPKNAKNSKPVILVGKGVVFDTGGLTLKPTPNSMDLMKSDMSGAAAVIGAFYAITKAKLPYHIVGLIPATDNRPGVRATEPGDVITMYDGTTVEVMNTDAEGRLILGDALHYAKKYNPEMVIDLATLTGAAARAIGQQGIVYMSTANEKDKAAMVKSGEDVYERCVEFPLWEEYGELIKSDIADLKNVSSGANAAAITAGKFLEHFTDYPWMHLDIAAPAFISANDAYRPKYGTGVGVRLLVKYLKNRY